MIEHIKLEDVSEALHQLPKHIEDFKPEHWVTWNDEGMISGFPEAIIKWINSNQYAKDKILFEPVQKGEQPWGEGKYDRLIFKKFSSTLKNKTPRHLNRTFFKQFLPFVSRDLLSHISPNDYDYEGAELWGDPIRISSEKDLKEWNDLIDIFNQFKVLLLENKPMLNTDLPAKEFIRLGYLLAEIGNTDDAEEVLNSIYSVLRPYYHQWLESDYVEFETDISWSKEFQKGELIPLNVWGPIFLSACLALGKLYKWMTDYEQAVEILEHVHALYDPDCVYGLTLGNRVLEGLIEFHHCYKLLGPDYAVETSSAFVAALQCYWVIHNSDKKNKLPANVYSPELIREPLLMIVLLLDRLYNWFEK